MRRFRHAISRRAIFLLRKRQTWAPGVVLEAEAAVGAAREAEPALEGAPGEGRAAQEPPALRAGFNKPPPGETRYERNRILIDSTASNDVLDAIAQQHNMTRGETFRSTLTGRTLHIFTINDATLVPDMVVHVAVHPEFSGAQPNYLYVVAQGGEDQRTASNTSRKSCIWPRRIGWQPARASRSQSSTPRSMVHIPIWRARLPPVSGLMPRKNNRICTAQEWREPLPRTRTCWGLPQAQRCLP
jgi:hypothetical protein